MKELDRTLVAVEVVAVDLVLLLAALGEGADARQRGEDLRPEVGVVADDVSMLRFQLQFPLAIAHQYARRCEGQHVGNRAFNIGAILEQDCFAG